MGLENKKNTLSVQTERRFLIEIISSVIKTNIELMKFHKRLDTDKTHRKKYKECLEKSEQSLIKLNKIKHIEILRSIYNNVITGKETYFIIAGIMPSDENIERWDTTEDGFKEFLDLEEKGKQEEIEEYQKKVKEQQALEEAVKQGKKVEYVFDKESGTTKPIIVEDKSVN